MARFILMIVLLVTAALANESSINKQQNQNLDGFSKVMERLLQLVEIKFSAQCILARSANLKMLSNGKMYHFKKTDKTWSRANELCTHMGLHMATIADPTEAHLLYEEGHFNYAVRNWWVSAKNQEPRGSEKVFHWHDGTKLELDSPLWWDEADKTEDCVQITYWENGKLNTFRCTGTSNVLCELPSKCY